MRKLEISISGLLKAHKEYSKDFFNAYVFAHLLRSQTKHPIILNYKQQFKQVRLLVGYSDYKFRRALNNAIRQGLITIEGKHIRILSKNQDKLFKPSKKNDYRTTNNINEFLKIALFENYYNKQYHAIKVQTKKSVNNSEPKANFNISCSTRAITKLFNFKSTSSGYNMIKYMATKNHIVLTKNKVEITKSKFRELLKENNKSIRYSNGTYYKVLSSTFKMKSNTKRTEFVPFVYLEDKQRVMYLEMGYSEEYINNLQG